MIELTRSDNKSIYVNPNQVRMITPAVTKTGELTIGHALLWFEPTIPVDVKGNPKEISELFEPYLKYPLRIIDSGGTS